MNKALLLAILLTWPLESEAQIGVWAGQPTPTTNWLLDVQFLDADLGYAVGDLGTLLRSTDGGLRWDSLPPPSGNTLNVLHFLNRDTGWVAGNGTGIILRTTDGGESWSRQDSGNSVADLDFVSPTTGWAVTFSPTTFSNAVLKTTDAGNTWIPQVVPDTLAYFTSVDFINPDTGWISGKFPGTVLRTTDGGSTWTEMTSGLDADEDYNEISFVDGMTGWLVGAGFDTAFNFFGIIKKTTNGGQSWSGQFTLPDIEFISVAFLNVTDGYVGGLEGYLFRTTNGGSGWYGEYTGVNRELSKIFVREGEGGWIVGPEGMFLRNNFGGLVSEYQLSMNGGWNMMSMPHITPEYRKDSLFPTAVSNIFYFDNGYTATDTVRNGIGYWLKFSSAQQVSILGRPLDSLTILLGEGWNLIGGIADDVPVGSISIASPTAVLSSFFRFDSAGYQPTTILSPGLGFWVKSSEATEITMLSGLAGKSLPAGILINPAMLSSAELPPPPPASPALSGGTAMVGIPAEYSLEQNYPNPFNPSTTIQIALPDDASVTLTVFDALGRTIANVLTESILPAGVHSIEWDPLEWGSPVQSSGIYFYRLSAVSMAAAVRYTDVKKMVFMK